MGNLSILELRNVSSDTTGNYSCSAYNTGGSIMMVSNFPIPFFY